MIYKVGLQRIGRALLRLEKFVIVALKNLGKLHEQIDGRVIEAGFDLTERTGGNIDTEQI